MGKKKKVKATTTQKVVAASIAVVYAPFALAFELAKPKKHRHGGRWCRKY